MGRIGVQRSELMAGVVFCGFWPRGPRIMRKDSMPDLILGYNEDGAIRFGHLLEYGFRPELNTALRHPNPTRRPPPQQTPCDVARHSGRAVRPAPSGAARVFP